MLDLYRPSVRAAGAIAVLLAWVGSLGWLGVRTFGQTEANAMGSAAVLRLAPGTAFYRIEVGAVQVGNASITLDTLSPGYRVSESVSWLTPAGVGMTRAVRRTAVQLGSTLNLERLQSDYIRAGVVLHSTAVLHGDTLATHSSGGKSAVDGSVRIGSLPSSSWGVPYRLALGGSLIGDHTRTLTLLDSWPVGVATSAITIERDSTLHFVDSTRIDPTTQRWIPARSDSTRAWSVIIASTAGPRREWIDHRGNITVIETPLGVRWQRTDFDLSESNFRKDVATSTDAIRAALPVITRYGHRTDRDTATAVRRFVVTHRDGSAMDLSLLGLLASGRQQLQSDTITIVNEARATGRESARDTVADPAIQYTDHTIAARARTMTAAAPYRRELMPAFVAEFASMARLDTSATAAEDAVGTLQRGAGQPDGIARLFVALVRAHGVPARYVIGVTAVGDTLLTHAWAEVWSGDDNGWYAVDPVNGRASASTALIRLATAGSSHPDQMLMLLANARFIELPARTRP